jgi:hypothetical protein
MRKLLAQLLVLLMVATASYALTGTGGVVFKDGDFTLGYLDQLVAYGRDGCGAANSWLGIDAATCMPSLAAAEYTVKEPFTLQRMTVISDDHSCIAFWLLLKNGVTQIFCQTNGETASTPGSGTCTVTGSIAYAKGDTLAIQHAEIETCSSDESTAELEILRTS